MLTAYEYSEFEKKEFGSILIVFVELKIPSKTCKTSFLPFASMDQSFRITFSENIPLKTSRSFREKYSKYLSIKLLYLIRTTP